MIIEMLRAARHLDEKLKEKLGRPYHAALGIGLILEIIGRFRELYDAPATSGGIVRLALVILLYVLLLIHQTGELSDHAAERKARPATGG
jgi:hypothetical protein